MDERRGGPDVFYKLLVRQHVEPIERVLYPHIGCLKSRFPARLVREATAGERTRLTLTSKTKSLTAWSVSDIRLRVLSRKASRNLRSYMGAKITHMSGEKQTDEAVAGNFSGAAACTCTSVSSVHWPPTFFRNSLERRVAAIKLWSLIGHRPPPWMAHSRARRRFLSAASCPAALCRPPLLSFAVCRPS